MSYDAPFWPATLWWWKLVNGISLHMHMNLQDGVHASQAIRIAYEMCHDTLMTAEMDYRRYIDVRFNHSLPKACYTAVKEACAQLAIDSSSLTLLEAVPERKTDEIVT